VDGMKRVPFGANDSDKLVKAFPLKMARACPAASAPYLRADSPV